MRQMTLRLSSGNIQVSAVFANDTDADGDTLIVSAISEDLLDQL